jgi:membrane protease YdiL (CAAX protease family)
MSASPPDTGPAPAAQPGNSISDRLPGWRESYAGISRSAVRWFEIVVGLLIGLGVAVLGSIVVGVLEPGIADGGDPSTAAALGLQGVFALGLITASAFASGMANQHGVADALRRLGMRWPGKRIVSTTLLAYAAYAAFALVIYTLFEPKQDDIAENLGADEDSPLVTTILAGVLIVAITPIAEELFFRGLLFGGLRQSIPFWPAAVISGIVFGVPHLTAGDVGVAVQLSLFGVILAWCYERSGTLWVPIGIHAFNNAIAFSILITT